MLAPGIHRDTIIRLGVILLVGNILLVAILAGAGVLKTAERGDITRTWTTTTENGEVTLPRSSPGFVIESPTDVDVFYNVVLHVRHGGVLYTSSLGDPFIQLTYNYSPLTLYLFVPLVPLGYLGFKFGWLLLSLGAVTAGTYLILRAEARYRDVYLAQQTAIALSLISLGFEPMMANFKTGQTTPIMYLFVAAGWYLYRENRVTVSGVALVGATLFKPYFAAPAVIYARRDRLLGVAGFIAGLILANVISAVLFGPSTLGTYYLKLLAFLFDEGATSSFATMDVWSATHFRPFYWLGEYSLLVRGALLLPVVYTLLVHAFGTRKYSGSLFSLAIMSTVVVLQTTAVVDLGMVLAVLLVLGVRFYSRSESTLLLVLLGSLCFLQAHTYVLELLVGAGSALPLIAANEGLVLTILPFVQPATYGTLLLIGLALSGVERPSTFYEGLVERHSLD